MRQQNQAVDRPVTIVAAAHWRWQNTMGSYKQQRRLSELYQGRPGVTEIKLVSSYWDKWNFFFKEWNMAIAPCAYDGCSVLTASEQWSCSVCDRNWVTNTVTCSPALDGVLISSSWKLEGHILSRSVFKLLEDAWRSRSNWTVTLQNKSYLAKSSTRLFKKGKESLITSRRS